MITLTKVGPVHCKRCTHHLGHITIFKSKPYFFDGLSLILVGFRRCPDCSTVFFWHGDKLKLDDVIRGYGQRNGRPVDAIATL